MPIFENREKSLYIRWLCRRGVVSLRAALCRNGVVKRRRSDGPGQPAGSGGTASQMPSWRQASSQPLPLVAENSWALSGAG